MPTSPSSPSSPRPAADTLDRLAAVLLDTRSDPVLAVGIAELPSVARPADPEDEGVELYLRPLGEVDDLIGFVAPASWSVVGVVASGVARSLDPPHRPEPVEVVHLVGRDGTAATWLRGADGDETRSDEVEGIVPDLCRRVLGLPTIAPREPATDLFDALWLDAVCATALARDLGDPRPGWEEVVACFPAPVAPGADASTLRRERTRAAGSWAALRRRAGLGRLHVPGLRRSGVAWMDDGLFARWSLSAVPHHAELLDDLAFLLPAPVARRIHQVLSREDASWAGGADGA
ncbi:MAG: hypothetical protein MUE34_01345 [Acidimicrobiales bacterium]|jgi:hypothetical protein|nr:hypothetical protein [Acidimicrobiales bacterium]